MKINNKKLINKIAGLEKKDPRKLHQRSNTLGRLRIRPAYIVVAVITVALAIIAASLAILFSERDEPKPGVSDGTAPTTGTYSDENELNTDFMLALTGSSREGLVFLAHMKINTAEGTFSIRAIDVDEFAAVDSVTDTLENHFNVGGITELQHALSACEQITPARYIVCSEENFTYFLSDLEPMTLTLEENIYYNFNGIRITIESGTREFTADEAMKYFCYLAEHKEENEEKLCEIFRLIAKNFFDTENTERLSELYSKVVNYFSTDVSALDVATYYKALDEFAYNGGIDALSFSSAEE